MGLGDTSLAFEAKQLGHSLFQPAKTGGGIEFESEQSLPASGTFERTVECDCLGLLIMFPGHAFPSTE